MNINDKPAFSKKMQEMARKVDRKMEKEQCDIFFDDLKDFPISVVEKAMDLALRERDVDDAFLRRAMLTIPEIRQAVAGLNEAKEEVGRVGCKACLPSKGWILGSSKDGRTIAYPCDCLAEVVRAELGRKGRTRTDRRNDKWLKDVLSAHSLRPREKEEAPF